MKIRRSHFADMLCRVISLNSGCQLYVYSRRQGYGSLRYHLCIRDIGVLLVTREQALELIQKVMQES